MMLRVMKDTLQSDLGIGKDVFLEAILHAMPYSKTEQWVGYRVISVTFVEQC